jgi:hypothetical protein
MLALALSTSAHAQSLPELQSRCGNDAAAFFTRYKRDQADPAKSALTEPEKDPPSLYDYVNHVNHYSESMKGCFIVIKEDYHWTEHQNGHNYTFSGTTYSLFGVNSHRMLGYFSKIRTNDPGYKPLNPTYESGFLQPIQCYFDDVECSGEAEWDRKVTPYVPGWKG